MQFISMTSLLSLYMCLKKNQNALRPCEHPPVRFCTKKLNISRSSEHPGGVIGCEDKRAPMVVTLGQQYHVGAFFCGTVHLLMAKGKTLPTIG